MVINPIVMDETGNRNDIFSSNLEERVIHCVGTVTDEMAASIVAQLLHLAKKSDEDISLYINSPGGSVSAGLAIYDTMRFIPPKVSTVCLGVAASMAAVILSGGENGMRYALPNSEVMIHQPSGGAGGQAQDIIISAEHIGNTRQRLNRLLSETDLLTGVKNRNCFENNREYYPRLCKENGIEVILSVGGGSVLDCSKAIAAGACYDGDPWDLITYKVKAKAALPIVDVLTLAATGSEYDCGGVISRTDTNDKIGYIDPLLFPVVSFLDPTYTFTVSHKQTAAGIADAMNHTIEQYFTEDTTLLNDGFCESMLRSLMINGRKCLENPQDYTARAEMMLCSPTDATTSSPSETALPAGPATVSSTR